jgi:hypothetical protein
MPCVSVTKNWRRPVFPYFALTDDILIIIQSFLEFNFFTTTASKVCTPRTRKRRHSLVLTLSMLRSVYKIRALACLYISHLPSLTKATNCEVSQNVGNCASTNSKKYNIFRCVSWPINHYRSIEKVKTQLSLKEWYCYHLLSLEEVIHWSSMALQAFVGPWPLLHFRNLFYTDCKTSWTSYQPVVRPLPTQRTTQTQNKRTHRYPCPEWNSNPQSQRSSERRQFMP